MKILNYMQKAEDIKSSSAADAHLNVEKMVAKQNRKEENR